MKKTFFYAILAVLFLNNPVTNYGNHSFDGAHFMIQLDTTLPNFSFMEKINDTIFNADFENDILMRLKINGAIVHPDEIKKYQKFVDKAQKHYDDKKAEESFYNNNSIDIHKMPNNLDVWEKTFKESLEADGLISVNKHYKIEFGDLALRIDGKTVSKQVYEKYLKQFKDITGVDLSGGYTLKDE